MICIMTLGLQQVRYFIAVAEELHFRRAAERVNLSQPALSRAISRIEEAVGVALFERTNRSVALTPAGARLLDGCTAALAALDGAVDQARKLHAGEGGRLTIGYTDFAIAGRLPKLVQSFRHTYPDIPIDAVHGCTKVQLEDLETGKLDIGFLTGPVPRGGYGCVPVQHDRFVVVLPVSHPLAELKAVPLAALVDEPFVLGELPSWEYFHAHLFDLCRTSGFEPAAVQYASNSEGIFGLVACGMGVSIQVACVENYFRKGVVFRPLRGCTKTVPTLAVWRTHPMPPIKARFIDHLEKALHPADRAGLLNA